MSTEMLRCTISRPYPSASTAAFMAPARAPLMPSNSIRPSSRRRFGCGASHVVAPHPSGVAAMLRRLCTNAMSCSQWADSTGPWAASMCESATLACQLASPWSRGRWAWRASQGRIFGGRMAYSLRLTGYRTADPGQHRRRCRSCRAACAIRRRCAFRRPARVAGRSEWS